MATEADWQKLLMFFTDSIGTNAGNIMREIGTQHWIYNESCFYKGIDSLKFKALPAGYRGEDGNWPTGPTSGVGYQATWWAITGNKEPNDSAANYGTSSCDPNLNEFKFPKKMGYSIRCVKD